ncbi:transcriptional regulator [Salmonella enterica]|nr:transcriptional regulator [Salmonella enterica]EAX4341545.1 transcriptional regulator [Salmonella enterica]EAY8989750.1 transcriptional regulator [Salmonella enterica]EBV8115688.1 transcriptional regulator [Salmonella enterica subsp. enterica serovar Baildon]ECJ6347580.1 transcriptional regulator [Salmonella enterica]
MSVSDSVFICIDEISECEYKTKMSMDDNSGKKEIPHTLFIPGEMIPGRVNINYFRLLLLVSNINNPKVCRALEDVFVCGETRKEACRNNGISLGYFSVRYHRLQFISHTVARMYPYITPPVI